MFYPVYYQFYSKVKSNIIKQTIYEMRRQPVSASVTLVGTAFAIFLLMTVLMIDSATTIPISPESRRDRILLGMNMHTQSIDEESPWKGSSSRLNRKTAERLYGHLEGIDTMTVYRHDVGEDRVDVKQPGHPLRMLYRRVTDEGFWGVFDHKLLAGKTYDRATVEAHAPVAVLTESAARAVTGSDPEEAVGQTVMVNHKPTKIIGVVADHSPLAANAFGEIFMPLTGEEMWDDIFGPLCVAMLRNEAYSYDDIKRQVMERYEQFNIELEPTKTRTVYHEQPYDTKTASMRMGSNTTPDTSGPARKQFMLILILLIVPAINMSAMTQSRLTRRMAETGVKRAYGASRRRIIADILIENMIVTLIGGAIGLVFSIAGAWLLSETFFNGMTISVDNIRVPWQLLFNWRIFAIAVGGCFVLNLLSAGIPAWRASRIEPVDALRG